MENLPKPSFSTEAEIEEGAKALGNTDDTTTDKVSGAVALGDVLMDNDMCHVRLLKKDDALLYQVFRGESTPDKFWGSGEFGLVLLAAAEGHWHIDKPLVEFHVDTCRPEVQEDSPRDQPRFPQHYYGAYLVIIRGMDRKLFLSDEKIVGMTGILEDELRKSISQWSE